MLTALLAEASVRALGSEVRVVQGAAFMDTAIRELAYTAIQTAVPA